jgi:hypothetical protein
MKHQAIPETNPMPPLAQPSNNNPIDTATLELFAKWRAEDATDDPEELRAAEKELAEFKKAMNENRAHAGEPVSPPRFRSSWTRHPSATHRRSARHY